METAELISKTMELLSKFFNQSWSDYSIKELNKMIEAIIESDGADLLDAWEGLTGENLRDSLIEDFKSDTGCRCDQ